MSQKHCFLQVCLNPEIRQPMSAICETYNSSHNVLELADILPNVSFTESETERDYH